MSDIQQPQDTPSAPVSAPVVDTPTPASESSSTPATDAPAATPDVVVETAPATEPAAEQTVIDAPAEVEVENVLGDDKEPAKKDDAPEKKDADVTKPDEAKPDADPAPLPAYDFTIPENVSVEKEPLEAFTKLLGEIETSKLDHAALQERGQKLVDMHIKGVQESIQRLNDHYVQIHEANKKEWFEAFKKDPDLGNGNEDRTREIASNLREAIGQYGGTDAQQAEFRALMKETGVGNHPALLRMLNNMDAKIKKYTTEADNGNGGTNRIVPAARPAPSKVKNYQQFYNGNN